MHNFRIRCGDRFLAEIPPYNPLVFVRVESTDPCLMYDTLGEAEAEAVALGLRDYTIDEYTAYGDRVSVQG